MPLDVVDIGDRVNHHKSQRKNQCEQGDPIDGEKNFV
jgi:hypothetical protein